jgi:hypothetical protein
MRYRLSGVSDWNCPRDQPLRIASLCSVPSGTWISQALRIARKIAAVTAAARSSPGAPCLMAT